MKTTKLILPKSFFALLILIIIILLSSCGNNPDTCVHSWGAPTCIEPAQCYKCDTYKTDGELGNHNYSPATCREPAKCIYCHQYKDDKLGTHEFSPETGYCYHCGISRDDSNNTNNTNNTCANGHIEGEWVVTTESTLIYYGTETLSCAACNAVIKSRSTPKKKPSTQETSFNFIDEEFIGWLNNNSKIQINDAELGLFDDQYAWTSYLIETPDKESGIIVFSHESADINSNIRSMLFIFDDYTTSIAIASVIGKGIDSNFDDAQAAISILFDDTYTSCGMSLIKFEDLFDDYGTIIALAPDGVLS